MDLIKLEKDDLENLEKIIKTHLSLEKLYEKLYLLEINNQQESLEYSKGLDYLNIVLEVEKDQIKSLNLDFYKCQRIIAYIFAKKLSKDFLNDIECITRGDYNLKIYRRLLYILYNKFNTYHDMLRDKLMSKEEQELLKRIGSNLNEEALSNQIYSNVEVKKTLDNDLYSNFLVFLQEMINNSTYKKYYAELIKRKYVLAFINPNIEEELIKNRFVINDKLSIKAKFIANLTNMPEVAYTFLKNSCMNDIYNSQIHLMLETSNFDYENSNQAVTSLLRQCFIRSVFLFMNSEEMLELNYSFHEFIESKDHSKESTISEQLIIDCFNQSKLDKEKLDVPDFKYKKTRQS